MKLHAKELIHRSTAKLFLISFFSFVLRGVLWLSLFCLPVVAFDSGVFDYICTQIGKVGAFSLLIFCVWLYAFFTICVSSAVVMGEKNVYYQKIYTKRAKFKYLFGFLSPQKSIRSFILRFKISSLRILWTIYFFLPSCVCLGCAYALHTKNADSVSTVLTLSAGTVLFITAIYLTAIAIHRYDVAPYYFCTHTRYKTNAAISLSKDVTDIHLKSRLKNGLSLIGWVFSCVFIVPIIYTVPYIKMCDAVYVCEMCCKNRQSSTCAVNILSLAPVTRAYKRVPPKASHPPVPRQVTE